MFGENGEHWAGPRLEPDNPDYEASLRRIRQNYVIQNMLSSVMSTHVNAVVGKEVDWELAPLNVEANDALTGWYYGRRVQETLQDACLPLLWATRTPDETSSILRFRIPKRGLNEQGQAKASGLEPVLETAVRLTHPRPGTAGMLRDEDDEIIAGWYAYGAYNSALQKDEPHLELVALESTFEAEDWGRFEDRPASANDETVVQIRSGVDFETVVSEAIYPLGGNLTIFEMSRPPLITEDVVSQQDGLNTQWTYLNRHSSASAFLERVILNGMPPGEWVDAAGYADTDGPRRRNKEGIEQVYKRMPYIAGPGQSNFITGITLPDGSLTNPSMNYREASSSQPLLENIKAHREAILELCNQQHRLILGDATSSAVSRVQALQDFTTSLGPTVTQVKLALNWTLKTALMLGSYLDTGRNTFADTDVDGRVTLWAAAPTADDQRMTIELRTAGFISEAEAMRRVGVADVVAMQAQIAEEGQDEPEPPAELVAP